MRVALVQQAAGSVPYDNLAAGLRWCAQARDAGADLVVFPELWQIGYRACPRSDEGRAAWLATAIAVDEPWLRRFRACAARLELALVVTFLCRRVGGVSNAAAVVDAAGELVFVHEKVHLCDFTWESVLVPGEEFRVAPVRTRAGTVRMGVMTCFDREFPESARSLALDGAEFIACPNASLLCDDRIGQLRSRAFENMTAVALANYPLPRMNGRSSAFDGIAVEHGRPRDHGVASAGPRAQTLYADIDLAALRRYREHGLWAAHRRRPAVYQPLAAASRTQESAR